MFYKRFLALLCNRRAKSLASVQPNFLIITLVWWLLSLSSICFSNTNPRFFRERERERKVAVFCQKIIVLENIAPLDIQLHLNVSVVFKQFLLCASLSCYDWQVFTFNTKCLFTSENHQFCHTEHTTCNYYYYFFSRINRTPMALAFVMAFNIVFNEWFMFGYVVYVRRAQSARPLGWVDECVPRWLEMCAVTDGKLERQK